MVVLLLAACQPVADNTGSGSESGDPLAQGQVAAQSEAPQAAGDEAAPAAAAPLPGLLAVMSDLDKDMARLSRGLWRADYDTIAAAARAVATHPKVPPTEARQIAGILGPDMAPFKGFDSDVHGLAVRIEERAREKDMAAVVTAEAELRARCVECHNRFRARVRDALR